LHVEKQGGTADDTGNTKKPEFAKDPTNEVDRYSIRQNPDGVVLDGKAQGSVLPKEAVEQFSVVSCLLSRSQIHSTRGAAATSRGMTRGKEGDLLAASRNGVVGHPKEISH
jgi:hypothetical protein